MNHLNDEERCQAEKLINKFSDRFYLNGDKLPATNVGQHRITTTDNAPVNTKQYRLPHALKEEVEKQVNELLEKGIIRKSKSSFNTSLWVVPKKEDSSGNPRWRVVLDFRPLNEKTIPVNFPLPNITDIFDQVGKSKYFTVIDCKSGFHQVELHPDDAYKTAFSTPTCHYEFVRMPFGLRNAAVEYQSLMNKTLEGLIGKGVFVYMDDIVIYAKNLEEHERLFNEVMKRLRNCNWVLEPDKCEILKKEVVYLGHILSEKGIMPDKKKIEAVKEFPTPKNIKNVRQFLGLAGYYRRFIKDFAKIAKPLTKLLQKDIKFEWEENVEQAFKILINKLCTAPVLQFPDMSRPFLITTDASGFAVGGILSQGVIGKDLPIAYTSRVLRGPELNYEVYEKEALAMLHAVQTFRPYIFLKKFTIYTDHQPLVWFKTAELNIRVQKWRFKLSGYDYEVVYRPGKINVNADALSRNPIEQPVINVVTRRQKQLENEVINNDKISENDDKEINNEKNKENAKKKKKLKKKIIQPKGQKRIRKAKQAVDYVDTESETDVEASIKINNTKQNAKSIIQEGAAEVDENDDNTIPDSWDEDEDINNENEMAIDKEKENNSEINSDDENLNENKSDGAVINLVECKDLIECRRDNIIYFIDNHGNPCDKAAKLLIEKNKIPSKQETKICEILSNKLISNKKYLIGLCIKDEDNLSQLKIKVNIYKTLTKLKTFLTENEVEQISFAKNEFIENITWNEIIVLLNLVFKGTKIKIIICKGTLIFIPTEKRDEIFFELHKSPIGGHRGVSKTFHRIRQNYYWENLKFDIQRRIQQCLDCQLKKLVRLKTKQPMTITDTPGITFDKIAMDIVGPLPKTKNNCEFILTMQDQLSKFCLAVPLQNALATTIADAFVKKFICIFGAPRVILTDQGRNFLSMLMKRVAKRFKIKRVKTTAFHPQSNGSLERSHHALSEFLKQYSEKDCEWDEWVDIAMLNYNTCVQESTKYTPYEVVFGKLARLPSNDPLKEGDLLPTYDNYMKNLVTRLTGIRRMVYDNLVDSKFKHKKYYDRNINPVNFKVGDFVYLLKGNKPNKFGDNYTGPHKVIEIIDKNIRIQIKNKTKIVHANRLRVSYLNDEVNKSNTRKKRKNNESDDE